MGKEYHIAEVFEPCPKCKRPMKNGVCLVCDSNK